jgi:flagellar biosynthetic protein FliP
MNIHRIVAAGKTLILPAFLMGAGLLIAPDVIADGLPALTTKTLANGTQQWSLSLQTMMLLSSMTFLPAIVLMMTGFTRIIIVLSLLRTAMGTQSVPPNQVLLGVALFLTFFVMSPVLDKVYDTAWVPFSQDKINIEQFFEKGSEPFKTFMLAQTRETDIARLAELAKIDTIETPQDTPLRVLLPAFALSEIKTAFQIGFTIFIPFLIIDLVVASVLMALGMMMVPPATISLPFKLMLFILADGWNLLIGSLANSFYM